MQQQDARLNVVVLDRGHGHGVHDARIFVSFIQLFRCWCMLACTSAGQVAIHAPAVSRGLNAMTNPVRWQLAISMTLASHGCSAAAAGSRWRVSFEVGCEVADRGIGPAYGAVRCSRWRAL